MHNLLNTSAKRTWGCSENKFVEFYFQNNNYTILKITGTGGECKKRSTHICLYHKFGTKEFAQTKAEEDRRGVQYRIYLLKSNDSI